MALLPCTWASHAGNPDGEQLINWVTGSRISRDPATPESRESYLVHLKDNRGVQKILPKTLPHFDLSLEGLHRIAIQLCTILQQSIILVLCRDKRR